MKLYFQTLLISNDIRKEFLQNQCTSVIFHDMFSDSDVAQWVVYGAEAQQLCDIWNAWIFCLELKVSVIAM